MNKGSGRGMKHSHAVFGKQRYVLIRTRVKGTTGE